MLWIILDKLGIIHIIKEKSINLLSLMKLYNKGVKMKTARKQRPKNIERYFLIAYNLRKKGFIFADIANDLKVHPSAITHFAYGYEKSQRFDNWVKDNLGIAL